MFRFSSLQGHIIGCLLRYGKHVVWCYSSKGFDWPELFTLGNIPQTCRTNTWSKAQKQQSAHFNRGRIYSWCCTFANEHGFVGRAHMTVRSSSASRQLLGLHTLFSRRASLEQAAPPAALQMPPVLRWEPIWEKAQGKTFSPANQMRG